MQERRQLDEIAAAIAAEDHARAFLALQNLWASQKTSAIAAYILGQRKYLVGHVKLVAQRVAVLRSFTVEPVIPILRADAFSCGVDATVHVGEFNAYAMEIMGGTNSLYEFDPDIVFLAVQTRDIAPDLWRWTDEESGQQAIGRVLEEYRGLLQSLRARHRANVVVHDFEQPLTPRQGLLDGQSLLGQQSAIQALNQGLRKLAAEIPGVFVLAYDALVAAHGRQRWFDQRKWLTARLPLAAESLVPLGLEWARFVSCLAGRASKVIVTDLDNTLWGGVVGEDGSAGLRMGAEYPGAGFRELQDALLACSERGIMLAIASKNSHQEAMDVLENHPDMLLRPKHFAAMRINWNSKAQSIREIAAELKVGIDSIAFVDDNPAERELVRRELPSVAVIELPNDPLGYAAAVRGYAGFERLTLSREDRERNRYYDEQKEREQLAASTSVEDFYRSLQQEIEIHPVSRNTVSRIAQLTQKTNQFNLTTKRYTEQDIWRLANSTGWSVLGATVRDRFGDNGLVGVLITRLEGTYLEIDTLLLSCRVIARTVESALLGFLVKGSRAAGCAGVRGWFQPTKKNQPAADFFQRHGFTRVSEYEGREEWELDLSGATVECPQWIHIRGGDWEPSERSLA